MIRLKNKKHAIYDTNIIIYYCFPETGKYTITLTYPVKKLTKFLFNQNTEINVPSFIIAEINRKGFYEIINDFFNSIDNSSKYRLYKKLEKNLKIFTEHDNFKIEEYEPEIKLLNNIELAFNYFKQLPNIDEYYVIKKTNELNPSIEDKKLILYSKEKEWPIITNDSDFNFFYEELVKRKLVHEIIDFRTIMPIDFRK